MTEPEDPSRRDVLSWALTAWGLFAVTGAAVAVGISAYPLPDTRATARVPKRDLAGNPVPVNVGNTRAALIPTAGVPVALSLLCTHSGCVVKWTPDENRFVCPCHGGKFDAQGKVLSGPPPRALKRLEVFDAGDSWEIRS